MVKKDLQDKAVVITGGAGGMGRAFAHRFGRAGAKIALLDINSTALDETCNVLNSVGIEAKSWVCDVTDAFACRRATTEIVNVFNTIDVLINNAGITHRSLLATTHTDVIRKVMEVNFFGALNMTQAALPYLVQSRGVITVISSIAGFSPLLGRTGYSASKYALHGLFESLRTELFAAGVRVMMVCPGFTATGIEHSALGGDGRHTLLPRSSTGKIDTPDSVAESVYRGFRQRKRLLVLTPIGKLAYWISRFFPAFYEKQMTRRLRYEFYSDTPPAKTK